MSSGLVFQESWMKRNVLRELAKQKNFSNPVVCKNFTKTLDVLPLVQITRFLNTTPDKALTATISDATHRMLAVFPFKPTIANFENKNHQRITYCTVNSLLVIRKANLRFVSREIVEKYYIPPGDLDAVILEILEVDFFSRDQVSLKPNLENMRQFLYLEPEYIRQMRPTRREEDDSDVASI